MYRGPVLCPREDTRDGPLVITAAGVVILLASLAGWLLAKAWPALRKFAWFVDDMDGRAGRPGWRPGRMSERMAILEVGMSEMTKHMASVRHHVQNDHQTNLRDDVDGIRDQLDDHVAKSAPQLEMLETLYKAWGRGAGEKSRPLDPITRNEDGK